MTNKKTNFKKNRRVACMKELFSDFEFANRDAWKQQVRKELNIHDADDVTTVPLSEDITQEAYCDFNTELPNQLQAKYAHCTANLQPAWQGARYWLNMERIKCSNSSKLNQLALDALKGGAEGVVLDVSGTVDWGQVLEGILMAHCRIAIEGEMPQITDFFGFLSKQGAQAHGSVAVKKLECLSQGSLHKLLDNSLEFPGFKCLVIETIPDTAGSLEEIAKLLSKAIGLINCSMDQGIQLKQIVDNIQIQLALSDAYLWEICRLRSLRILFHQVVSQYGLPGYDAGSLMIHATVGAEQNTTGNQDQQLLRNTTQAMSAVLGGCNLLTTVPHQGGFSCELAGPRRISRNIGLILREEGNFHRVADPVAGSYYLESLTGKMLPKIWSRLQELERAGGFIRNHTKDKIL